MTSPHVSIRFSLSNVSSKEISVGSGWQTSTQPLFDALAAAGLKPRMIREPNESGVATCVLVPRTKAAQARIFAAAWNAARAATQADPYNSATVSTYEL